MSELEQAKELHAEAVEMLRQSRQMHDLTMSNQRSLVYALSCLVPQHMVTIKATVFEHPENIAEQIADNARCVAEAMKTREVFDIVHAINVLAMANVDVLDVVTEFAGNVNQFNVRVFTKKDFTPILRLQVVLNEESALEELLSIENQLTELIIEAREQAEAKAEVKS